MNKLFMTILIVAAVALAAVYYFLGTDYLKQRQENQALALQVSQSTEALAKVPSPPPNLAQKLAEAEAGLASVQSDLPPEVNSTRLIRSVLQMAKDLQVKAIPLESTPWLKDGSSQRYRFFRLNIAVTGSYAQLTDFVSRLESGQFLSLVVESLNISSAAAPPGETPAMTAQLTLSVYGRVTPAEQGAEQ